MENMNLCLDANNKLYNNVLLFLINEKEDTYYISNKGYLTPKVLKKMISFIYGQFKSKHIKTFQKFLRGKYFFQIKSDIESRSLLLLLAFLFLSFKIF